MKCFDGRPYLIRFIIAKESCRIGKWVELDGAAFERQEDLHAFSAAFEFLVPRHATVRETSKVVTKTRYTESEYAAEYARITALAEAEGWTNRRLAAFRAHLSRRKV